MKWPASLAGKTVVGKVTAANLIIATDKLITHCLTQQQAEQSMTIYWHEIWKKTKRSPICWIWETANKPSITKMLSCQGSDLFKNLPNKSSVTGGGEVTHKARTDSHCIWGENSCSVEFQSWAESSLQDKFSSSSYLISRNGKNKTDNSFLWMTVMRVTRF